MANIAVNGTVYYNAPKNGGTTVRMWAKQAESGLSAEMIKPGYYDLEGFGLPTAWHQRIHQTTSGKWIGFRQTPSTAVKWCIKRDPIDRFLSGYTDKILGRRFADWDLETAIGLLERDGMQSLLARDGAEKAAALHLAPQVFWLGDRIDYYTHVFDLAQMDEVRRFCETEVFEQPLAPFHARDLSKASLLRPELSPLNRARLRAVFAEDYAAGWC